MYTTFKLLNLLNISHLSCDQKSKLVRALHTQKIDEVLATLITHKSFK